VWIGYGAKDFCFLKKRVRKCTYILLADDGELLPLGERALRLGADDDRLGVAVYAQRLGLRATSA